MKQALFRSALALGAALDILLIAPAFAQPADSGPAPATSTPVRRAPARRNESAITDVIVTARRIQERVQDVPISITVLSPKQIANRNIVNAEDLAKSTPSLSVNSNFGTENSSFAIRGFVQDAGTPPSVGVYFDEVVAPRGPTAGTQAGDGAGPGSFFDLQNIQVLKGPQGTLFGRNTTGGAVLLVPNKPSSKFGGYIEQSVGNYGMERTQGVINVPVTDKLRFRIAVDHQTRDGWQKNNSGIGPTNFNDVNYTAMRASLDWDVAPDVENYTVFSYSDSETNGSYEKVIGCNPNSFFGGGVFPGDGVCGQLAKHKNDGFYTTQNEDPDPYSRLRQNQVINTTTWHASDSLTVKNIVSYAQLKDEQDTPLFGTDFNLFGVHSPFTLIAPAPGADTTNESTFTEELQLQGNVLDDRLTYQTGFYFERSLPLALEGNQSYNPFTDCTNLAALQCQAALPSFSGLPASVNYTVGQTAYRDIGAYAQATYKLTEKLSLTGGFRYTFDHVDNSNTRISYVFVAPNVPFGFCTDAGATPRGCHTNLKESSSAPTGVVDLDYKITPDILTYVKYSRGYRSGGVSPNSPANYRVFNPEKVDDYEIGYKQTFRGAIPGTFDVDGFYNNFSNQQLQVGFNAANPNVSPTTGTINAGKSRIFGAELSGSVSPIVGVNLSVDYTYLNASLLRIAQLESTDPNYVIGESIGKGDQLALAPHNKLALSGNYTLPLDPALGPINMGATYTFQDSQLTNYAYYVPSVYQGFGSNLGILPPVQLLDLNASWSSILGRPIDLSAFATNVTQRKYKAFAPGLGGSGFETAVLGQPRMFGFRLRYRFGG